MEKLPDPEIYMTLGRAAEMSADLFSPAPWITYVVQHGGST